MGKKQSRLWGLWSTWDDPSTIVMASWRMGDLLDFGLWSKSKKSFSQIWGAKESLLRMGVVPNGICRWARIHLVYPRCEILTSLVVVFDGNYYNWRQWYGGRCSLIVKLPFVFGFSSTKKSVSQVSRKLHKFWPLQVVDISNYNIQTRSVPHSSCIHVIVSTPLSGFKVRDPTGLQTPPTAPRTNSDEPPIPVLTPSNCEDSVATGPANARAGHVQTFSRQIPGSPTAFLGLFEDMRLVKLGWAVWSCKGKQFICQKHLEIILQSNLTLEGGVKSKIIWYHLISFYHISSYQ